MLTYARLGTNSILSYQLKETATSFKIYASSSSQVKFDSANLIINLT